MASAVVATVWRADAQLIVPHNIAMISERPMPTMSVA
jgi:hypothetical protein